MNWDERYREAGLKDWADRQRTKRITKEFQEYADADAKNHHGSLIAQHATKHDEYELMGHLHDELANHLYTAANLHARAHDAHTIALGLLSQPNIDREIINYAAEHANALTRMANENDESLGKNNDDY